MEFSAAGSTAHPDAGWAAVVGLAPLVSGPTAYPATGVTVHPDAGQMALWAEDRAVAESMGHEGPAVLSAARRLVRSVADLVGLRIDRMKATRAQKIPLRPTIVRESVS